MTDRQENRQTDRPAERQGDRTMKEIISDAVERQLKKDPSEDMSLEEFAAIIERAEARRRKRRLKWMSIAAMFLLAIVGATLALNTLTTDVGANKNEKEEIVTEDGVVIEDGGWGSSDGEDNVWSTTDWAEVEAMMSHEKTLIIPRYIPQGFEFEHLIIEQFVTGNRTYEYLFSDKTNKTIEIEVSIQVENMMALDIDGTPKQITSSKGKIYIQEKNTQIATMQIDDGINIFIIGALSEKEIINIIENLNV